MKINSLLLILFLTFMNPNIKANTLQNLKDIGIGIIAGMPTIVVANKFSLKNSQYEEQLRIVASIITAGLALRAMKERNDINAIHLLSCLLTTIITPSVLEAFLPGFKFPNS